MVNERQYIFLRINLIIDMLIIIVALVAAYYFRTLVAAISVNFPSIIPSWAPEIIPYEESHILKEYIWVFPFSMLLWPLVLARNGYYDVYDLNQPSSRLWMIVKSSIISTIFLVLFIFVFKLQFIARIVVIGLGVFATILLILKEIIGRKILIKMHQDPARRHNIIMVGAKTAFSKGQAMINQYKAWGLVISQELEIDTLTADGLAKAIISSQAEQVVFSLEPEKMFAFKALAQVCEELGVSTKLLLDFYTAKIARSNIEKINNIPVLALNPTTQNYGALTIKILGDKIISLTLLLILSPLLLVISLLIKITSKGPVVIKQKRCGTNGRIFTLYKFRSMIVNAESLKAELKQDNQMEGWAFKMQKDPRVTPLGRFLRKYSLDELLQLWNVLRGDMSLVGPRPALPAEVGKFELWERRRLSMKPGMTGLWQVSGRNKIPNDEWVSYDLKYIDNWNLKLDLTVLLKTISTVIKGEGL